MHPPFLPIHKAQLLSYMKLLDIPLGLIINFNVLKLTDGVSRLILPGEAVKKLGQAPRSYAKSLLNTDIRSEPVPFFHSLGANLE